MKNWKKNAVVASILVFVCAGIYLNWMYTQDQETANLTDTLNEEKILGNSTLVMSQTGSLAADAAKEDLQAASGQTTDYFAAVRLSRQQSPFPPYRRPCPMARTPRPPPPPRSWRVW